MLTKKRIKEISVLQTSKIAAVIYAALGFFGGLILFASTDNPTVIFISPILYGTGGFLATAMSAAIYNVLAKQFGGFEFTIENEPFPLVKPFFTSTISTNTISLAPDTDEELRRLAKLKEDGVITEDEFNQKKKLLLGL